MAQQFSRLVFDSAAALMLAFAASGPAYATLYTVDVYEGSGAGAFNATLQGVSAVAGLADASHARFTYNGNLNLANTAPQNSDNTGDITSTFYGANAANISDYMFLSGPTGSVAYGAGGANFTTLASYMATSGSVNGYGYGSIYVFTYTGPTAGTNLTITHDDGVGVYTSTAGSNLLPGTTTGPTSAITETVMLPGGLGGYRIVYGRENGSASILNVAVPEPASIALIGAGLLGMGFARRKRA